MAKGLSDHDIEVLVGRMIDEADEFVQEDLAKDREKATDYYMGRKFGNEEEGRSQVVSTDVRDTVQSMIPSLMRIFFGSERPVEYRPRSKEDIADAMQKTDYTNYVITEDNNGFVVFHGVFKDALVRRTGIVKWRWDDSEIRHDVEYTGLSEENLDQLIADPHVEVEITAIEEPVAPGMPSTWSATVSRIEKGRVRIEATPPEEILWNRNARSFPGAIMVTHSRQLRLDELVAMGHSRKTLEGLTGPSKITETRLETRARRSDEGSNMVAEEAQDEATRPIRFDESYVRLDIDGDGTTKLVKVDLAGDQHKMLGKPQPVSHLPFALFCPDPEPHTIVGLSIADYTMDVQKIKSMIQRGTLDSLSLAILPRTEVVEGQVNMKDVLNTEVGGIIRARAPGMMREVKHSFVGTDTLPMLQYFDDVLEKRTGQSKASQGLDADVLQSTTKAAVSATLTKAQERIEMVARIFAETGMKDVFRGLLQTIVEHQDRPRTVRLRNQYVEIDPRSWDATMDVMVNIALGAGLTEEKLATLREIASDQTQIMQQLGPTNPLVSLRQLRNTRARIVELAGFKNAEEFYKEITEEEEQQIAQAAAQQPETGDATQALAQAEMAKAEVQRERNQAEMQLKSAQLELDRQELALKEDRERDKMAQDLALQLLTLESKGETSINREELRAEVAAARALIDAEAKIEVAEITKRE